MVMAGVVNWTDQVGGKKEVLIDELSFLADMPLLSMYAFGTKSDRPTDRQSSIVVRVGT